MAIQPGDKLPDGRFMKLGASGPETVEAGELARGRTALFAAPGAFTPTCHLNHLPSVVNAAAGLRDKGVERIVFYCVNDPFVMAEWARDAGAEAAGVELLADPDASFTRALGLEFDGSAFGLGIRAQRFAMMLDQGVVTALSVEDSPGEASCSRGEALIEALEAQGA